MITTNNCSGENERMQISEGTSEDWDTKINKEEGIKKTEREEENISKGM